MAFSAGSSGNGNGRSRFRGSTGTLSEINVVPLVDVVLVLLIIFMGLRRRPVVLGVLVCVIIAAAGLAFYFRRTDFASPTISRSVARTNKGMDLEPGKGYFWKVIVDDGNGGSTESETRRFEVK